MARIVVDLQACQTQSRKRGMGRYAREITKCLIELAGDEHEIHLVLNANLKASLVEVINDFETRLPAANIHLVKMPSGVGRNNEENRPRAQCAALIWERYIEAISPDVVFCPSLFEGFSDDAVTVVGEQSEIPYVVTIHDLIPLINPQQYLNPFPDFKLAYLEKVEQLKKATALIAISDSSRQEAIEHLNADPMHIVNASEAADDIFQPRSIGEAERSQILEHLGIENKFLLYTGGADPRKNLLRLVDAVALLPEKLISTHQLVFAGSMPEFEQNELKERAAQRGIADRLVFTGYVSDASLIDLFNLAELFVFPSKHEGFGLPPLEAMQCKTAAIGSNCTSIPEVIGDPRALFDPNDTKAISEKIRTVLCDDDLKRDLENNGLARSKKFSWMRSAKMVMEELLKYATARQHNPSAQAQIDCIEEIEDQLLSSLIADEDVQKLDEAELNAALQCIADNKTSLMRRFVYSSDEGQGWRLEGPFDSSYSLALVNRELALALQELGENVSLWSSEGPGDFAPNPTFLKQNPNLADMHERAKKADNLHAYGAVSRNMYPPRVSDTLHHNLGLHNYAWEESALPKAFANSFNEYLRFITATSSHTKKILMDNGVDVPITVVGNGVDHWDRISSEPEFVAPGKTFRFLHVSSCFPRKGADVLLKAFGQAFTANDDVTLIVKTFDNPHNTVQQDLASLQSQNPNFPDVVVLTDEFTDEELKALYEQSHVLVAPSRAEGFGLPIAEAMLSGLNVITTNWSGQLDFCNQDNVKLIDFDYALSETHEGTANSVWAEPNVAHLTELLRDAFKHQRSDNVPKMNARDLREKFSWAQSAKRNTVARKAKMSLTLPKVGWVSTFKKRCGIATYTEHLLQHFDCPTVILADYAALPDKADEHVVVKCWKEGADNLSQLRDQIDANNLDLLHIQFNYGFFNFKDFNQFLLDQKRAGRTLVVTLHSTLDPKDGSGKELEQLRDGLAACDRLLVHSVNDLNRLKALRIDHCAVLIPHGCLTIPEVTNRSVTHLPTKASTLTIATYGFLLPNKGILETVEAAKLLSEDGWNVRLRLVNALYPADVSRRLLEQVKALVADLGLSDQVELSNEFLPDNESFELLRDADLLLYPYGHSGESASGAVRYGIATGKPVLVSPSPIFDDVAQAVHFLPGNTPNDIASGIEQVISQCNRSDPKYVRKHVGANNWREAHGFATVSRQLTGLIRALHQDAAGKNLN